MDSVYILYSNNLDTFYKGQTSDLTSRLKRHNNRLVESTKFGVPWTLLWTTTKVSRSAAVLLELKVKNLSRQRTILFMLKFNQDIIGHDEAQIIQRLS